MAPIIRLAQSAWLERSRRAGVWYAIVGVALLAAIAGAISGAPSLDRAIRQFQGLATIFLGIFIEALPFLLAGVIVSSAIHLLVSPAQVRRLSPRSPVLAAIVGSLLGLAFPVCECGSVPTARRLLAKGAPLPLGIAFVLAAPAVNPIVIASTWVAFGGRPWIVVGRVVLTVLIAAAIGMALGIHPRPHDLLASPRGPGSRQRGVLRDGALPGDRRPARRDAPDRDSSIGASGARPGAGDL